MMAALERTMKIQEVILRALAKKITWWQAAEIIGITDRQMRRCHWRYQEYGYDGLLDRRVGKPSPKRVPLAVVEQVFSLYREKYFDLNVRHFHEKLGAEHQIRLSYTWVKKALQGAGLVSRERKRGVSLAHDMSAFLEAAREQDACLSPGMNCYPITAPPTNRCNLSA
jgi:transposase